MSYFGEEPVDFIDPKVATNVEILDMRSDAMSRPNEAMRQAMFEAKVGNDVYGEDPTVNELEEKTARLLGKEAAVFVSSATMGNLIATMVHCDRRDSEAYCGKQFHIARYEQGGASQIGSVTLCLLPNKSNGTFDLDELESEIRSAGSMHESTSKLVMIENTFNGRVVPQSWIEDLARVAKKHGLKIHLDGARLCNAVAASDGPSAAALVANIDSVTFSINKGLGAPVGGLLCGSKSFVQKARRVRKVLGGGMSQAGIIAAAGIVSLDRILPQIKEDHERARKFAEAIVRAKFDAFTVDSGTNHTNLVFVKVRSDRVTATDLVARLRRVLDDVEEDRVLVRGMLMAKDVARFAFYGEIGDRQLELAIKKVKYVMKILSNAACDCRDL